jgi:putative protease
MAVDAYMRDPEGYTFDPALNAELDSVSHREYCKGFYLYTPVENANLCATAGYIREKAYLALADQDCAAGEMCRFVQRNKFLGGDTVELVSPGQLGRPFKIEDLTDAEGNPIESAPHPGMVFYARAPFDIRKFDIIRAGEC